jgi:pilus assembly protein CpaB
MRAKTILTVLFLISLAVAVIVIVRAMPQMAPAGAQEAARDEILVATAELPAGTLLRPQDVVWQRAKADTQPGQIVRPDAGARDAKPELDEEARSVAYGAALRKPLAAGDPIRRSDFVRPGDRDFLQIVLSPGTRAIVIPVHMVNHPGSSARFLGPFPGDRVDVILTQKFQQDALPLTRRSVGEAVVENLRVLAVAPPDPKPVNAAAISANQEITIPLTLEVTPEQAEKITVARELGKLDLTLRSLAPSDRLVASAEPPARARAIWAGDVSPALGGAMPEKPVTVERPPVEVIHGSKSEHVSTPWHPDSGRGDRAGNARTENGSSSASNDGRGQSDER